MRMFCASPPGAGYPLQPLGGGDAAHRAVIAGPPQTGADHDRHRGQPGQDPGTHQRDTARRAATPPMPGRPMPGPRGGRCRSGSVGQSHRARACGVMTNRHYPAPATSPPLLMPSPDPMRAEWIGSTAELRAPRLACSAAPFPDSAPSPTAAQTPTSNTRAVDRHQFPVGAGLPVRHNHMSMQMRIIPRPRGHHPARAVGRSPS